MKLEIGHGAPLGVFVQENNAPLCPNEPKSTQFTSLLAWKNVK